MTDGDRDRLRLIRHRLHAAAWRRDARLRLRIADVVMAMPASPAARAWSLLLCMPRASAIAAMTTDDRTGRALRAGSPFDLIADDARARRS